MFLLNKVQEQDIKKNVVRLVFYHSDNVFYTKTHLLYIKNIKIVFFSTRMTEYQ